MQAAYLGDALSARMGEFIRLRRDIHAHPELAFAEHRTAALVAGKLADWGYEVSTGIGGTGVVGRLQRGQGSKTLGLRADMDALPILENTGHAWASRSAGLMHACGHDGHTAILLAAARLIAEDAPFNGTLHLIFQPAEEGAGGALPDDVASPRLQPPMGTSYPSQLDGSNGSYAEPPRIGAVLGAPRPPRPPLPWPFPVRRSYGVGRLVGTSWTVTAFRYPGPTTLGL
jgi:hypothetical protein